MLSSYQNNQIKILKEETQHLPLGTNTLTFVWSPSLPLHYSSVFDTSPLIKSENILWGGWTQRTPHDNTKLKRQGINNFDTALYNKKNIYLVAQPYLLKILQSYIKEHYNTDVTFKVLYSYKRSPFETNLVQVIKK